MQKSTRLRWWLTAVLALVVMVPAKLFAQSATITGKVTNANGEPLLAANVTIDALTVSQGTNASGQYTIVIPGARVTGQQVMLRVRAIGYAPVAKAITLSAGSQTQDFQLKEDVNKLSQVVVTGVTAGTEQKKLPFTVAQVSDKDMPVPGGNAITQLQGKVPGANIVSQSGRPGSTPSIILRGPQSINASGRGQDPLFIVDGVIVIGSLPDINPNDIENVEVVKGAAAASLYGSRAGYGVINITTKSGKSTGEGVRFTTRVEGGASDIEGKYKSAKASSMIYGPDHQRVCQNTQGSTLPVATLQNCQATVNLYDEALRVNEQGGDYALNPVLFMGDYGISSAPSKAGLRGYFQVNKFPTVYDPVAQIITNGPFLNASVDMTGKFNRSNFFASVGNFYQEGSMRFLDGFRRKSLRLNIDNTLGGNWTFSSRAYYANVWSDGNGSPASLGLTRQPAFVDLLRKDKFGRLFIRTTVTAQGSQNTNPLYTASYYLADNNSDRFTGQMAVRWQPFTWLDGEWNFGYDRSNYQGMGYSDKGLARSSTTYTSVGSASRSDSWDQSYNTAFNLTARKDLLSDLTARLTARALYEQQDGTSDAHSCSILVVSGLHTTNACVIGTTNVPGIGSSDYSTRQIGLFAGIDLEWKERYILGGLFRRDGSSLFGASSRWKSYGRGSFAYRVSEEKWWPAKKFLNDFKLRASLGQAGNRPNQTAQYETYSIGSGGVLSPNVLGNRNLRPEVSTETELGFDAEIMSKYGLTVTKARSVVDDQILNVPVAAAAGFNSVWKNAGQLTNNTWEASLNIPIVEKRDFSWTARVNYDRTTSVITRLDVNPYFVTAAGQQGSESMFQVKQGEVYGTIYGRRFITQCSQFPVAYQSRCGDGLEWQKNNEGYIVWVGAGNKQSEGITRNLWMSQTQNVGTCNDSPWGCTTNVYSSWGMPIILRDTAAASFGTATLTKNGSALPDYRWSLGQNFQYKKLSVYALFDAVKGNNIWNEERQWSYGDLMHQDVDQYNKTVETAKPIGYYWRNNTENTAGVGGLYDILGPSSRTVEDASYIKLREVSVGYRFGKIAGRGDWTLSLVGRNLKTWTNYNGFDPEVGLSGGTNGSGALNAIDAYTFPNLRTFTLTLTTSF